MGASKVVQGLEREVEKLYRRDREDVYCWSVSFLDLINDEEYTRWINTLDLSDDTVLIDSRVGKEMVLVNYRMPPEHVVKAILFKLGMDITDNYEEQTVIHRTWSGDVVNTLRWVGKMREDLYWTNFMNKHVRGI